MAAVIPGRHTARIPDEGVAVFLIGMRINRPLKVQSWYPVATAMPKMLRHLMSHPDSGLLGVQSWFGRTTLRLSYWRTAEDIRRFASDPEAPHAPAWREFNRKVAATGDVGIWHETYLVPAGSGEAIYGSMPRFGLAAATEHVPVGQGSQTWKQRMRDRPEQAAAR